VVLVGESGVGKSALSMRGSSGLWREIEFRTVGVDFFLRYEHSSKYGVTKMQVWDTAGGERFRTITVSYYKGAHAIVVLFDVAQKCTFIEAKEYISDIQQYASTTTDLVLCAHKCDNADLFGDGRAALVEEAQAFAAENGMSYIEADARTNRNVDQLFYEISTRCAGRLQAEAEVR
jgi:Ras-related protein Rab-1A